MWYCVVLVCIAFVDNVSLCLVLMDRDMGLVSGYTIIMF